MIGAIIQARMSSTRLPGKVLREINGKPMLIYMLERVAAAKKLDKVVLATTIDPSDDPIVELCAEHKILCYRGSLEDVLDRYYQAAKEVGADTVVRLTADCPLIDPKMIDCMIDIYKDGQYDYVANTTPPKWTVPEGMDVEIFSFENLERIWRETTEASDREHVTFYMWQNPQIFSVFRYDLDRDLSKYRLTVDYPEDLKLVNAIVSELHSKSPLFSMEEIVEFLNNHPEVYEINANIKFYNRWRSAYDESDDKASI